MDPSRMYLGVRTPQITTRRTFFSFHHQADIFEVNQVRQSWRYRKADDGRELHFFDGSLWEKTRRTEPESIKTLIRNGMKNTSVTCVLAGQNTFERRWVRYEIVRSIIQGNGLFTVFLDEPRDISGNTIAKFHDPLSFIGLYKREDGTIYVAEKDARGNWIDYSDYQLSIQPPSTWKIHEFHRVKPISSFTFSQKYKLDIGNRDLPKWIHRAAITVGR